MRCEGVNFWWFVIVGDRHVSSFLEGRVLCTYQQLSSSVMVRVRFPSAVILSAAPAPRFRPASFAGRAGAKSKDLLLRVRLLKSRSLDSSVATATCRSG